MNLKSPSCERKKKWNIYNEIRSNYIASEITSESNSKLNLEKQIIARKIK